MSAPDRGVEVERLLLDLAAVARGSRSWRSISASIPRSRKRNEFMFFSSVLVPSVASPAGRIDTLASIRSEPSSMFTSETPMRRSVAWSSAAELGGLGRRAQVGLGHDLHERRAAAVEVDDARLGAVDAARAAGVHELGRVLLQVHAVDAHVAEAPAACRAGCRTG